jgi:peptidoglycan LD-endopeptidase CwlK
MKNFKFGEKSLEKLSTVDKDIQDVFLAAIENSPIDFGISHGKRTTEEQFELWKQGRTQQPDGSWKITGKIVTKLDGVKLRSRHQDGKAVDVFAYVNNKASYDPIHLAIIAGVVLSEARRRDMSITWGGTFGSKEFKGWDSPHFEKS